MTRSDGLTPQQGRVAELVAAGHPDKAIAVLLKIDVQTVRFHVSRIVAAWNLDKSKNRRVEITKRLRNTAA